MTLQNLWPSKMIYSSWQGTLQRVNNFDFLDQSMLIPTNTNLNTIDTLFQSQTRSDFWDFDTFVASSTRENEQTYRSQKCWVWVYARTFDERATFVFNLQDYNDYSTITSVLGSNEQSIAGTSVNVENTSQENLGINAAQWSIVVLDNKSWDWSVVTSVTINLWGTVSWGTVSWGTALIAWTDYTVSVDADGSKTGKVWYSYITFLIAQTGQLSAQYTYTPSASKFLANSLNTKSLDFMTLRILTCVKQWYNLAWQADPTKAIYDEITLHKCSITSEYSTPLYWTSDAFAWVSLTFAGEEGGLLFKKQYQVTI